MEMLSITRLQSLPATFRGGNCVLVSAQSVLPLVWQGGYDASFCLPPMDEEVVMELEDQNGGLDAPSIRESEVGRL